MQIHINTDHNIQGREALATRLTGVVAKALERVAEQITRVDVHLSIESGGRSGQSDKRCVMEARLEGLQPIVVSEQSGTLDQAVDGASSKLLRAISSTRGRLRDKDHRTADRNPAESAEPEGLDEPDQA
jgi:ribosome-associated translation inhibitor RaiA